MFTIEILDTPENRQMLESFKLKFNGSITSNERLIRYRVTKIEDLVRVRKFFTLYPQETTKRLHFEVWGQMQDIILEGGHLTMKGLEAIIAQTGRQPKGVSAKQQKAFPHIKPDVRLEFIPSQQPLEPDWVAGFVSADGSFSLHLSKAQKSTVGYYVKPNVVIAQHSRDLIILQRIQQILGGIIVPQKDGDNYTLQIHKRNMLQDTILPFFSLNRQHGSKKEDFKDFSKGMNIIKEGRHQTEQGISEIKDQASKMNSKRYPFNL